MPLLIGHDRRAILRTVALLGIASLAVPAVASADTGVAPAPARAALCGPAALTANSARNRGGEITSVGITYFAGRSRDGDDAHLAAALTTELARQLLSARVAAPDASRGSGANRLLTVKLFAGGKLSDVDLSMTGSVFRDDTLLRTSARVTRTSDGAVLWVGSRARPILELPVLARLIAQEVVTRIGARLSTPTPSASPEKSSEMYELVLRGEYIRSRYDADDLARAIDFYEQALAMEPKSARVRNLRDGAGLRLLAWGGKGTRVETRLLAQGRLERVLDRVRDESERLIEEADAEIRDGETAHACQLLNAAIENDARAIPAYALRSLIRARGSEVREAFADAEIVTQLGRPMWGNALRATVLIRAGDTTLARQVTRRLATQLRLRRGALPFWDARFAAVALTELGDSTAAQAVLRRIDRRDPRLAWLRNDPSLQPPRRLQRPSGRTR